MKRQTQRRIWIGAVCSALALGLTLWTAIGVHSESLSGPRTGTAGPGTIEQESRVRELDLESRRAVDVSSEHARLETGIATGPGLRIHGSVVDGPWPQEAALPPPEGVTVSVAIDGASHQAVADDEGRFELRLDQIEAVPHHIHAKVDGNELHREASVEVDAGRAATEVALVLLRPAQGRLAGEVVDLDGHPVADARVWFTQTQSAWDESPALTVESITDSAGRFSVVLDPWKIWQEHAVRHRRFRLWTSTNLRQVGRGFEPLRITMAPAGEVVIVCEDAEGNPVRKALFELRLYADDLWRIPGVVQVGEYRASLEVGTTFLDIPLRSDVVPTDEHGAARFESVWADRRLVVCAHSSSGQERTANRQLQGLLQFGPGELPGDVIRVPRGGSLALRAQPFGVRRTLSGSAHFEDGKAVRRPSISVVALERSEGEAFGANAIGEEDGTFSLLLDDLRLGETLLVRAADGRLRSDLLAEHAGTAELHVGDGPLQVELVLSELLSISGEARYEDGRPFRGNVLASPEQPGHAGQGDGVNSSGAFVIKRLQAGSYELRLFDAGSMGSTRPALRLAGVRAGTSGLSLTVPNPADLRLAVHLNAPNGLSEAALLVAQPTLGERIGSPWPIADANDLESTVAWPIGVGQRTVHGQFQLRGLPFRGGHRSLMKKGMSTRGGDELGPYRLRLPPSVYAFGLTAWDSHGQPYATILTQPASYSDEDYVLTFDLAPTGSVAGRVDGTDATQGVALMVTDASGARLPMFQGDSDANWLIPLAADGSFRVDRLPAGRLTVRVGTPFDLERGSWGLEQTVEVTAGATSTVSLRW